MARTSAASITGATGFRLRCGAAVANDFFLAGARGITHANAHQETIELRFRKRVSAVMLDGILCRDYQKRIRQRVRVIVHRHLGFAHGFEQRGLRFRRGAIDFVGQHHVGENRAGLEFEILAHWIENADADYVARQHVGSKLHALKAAMKRACQSLRQSGFADAGDIFDQQMAAREQRDKREVNRFFLALHYAGNRTLQFRELVAGVAGLRLQLLRPFATKMMSLLGRLAQWLERSPHTGEVQGSSP